MYYMGDTMYYMAKRHFFLCLQCESVLTAEELSFMKSNLLIVKTCLHRIGQNMIQTDSIQRTVQENKNYDMFCLHL